MRSIIMVHLLEIDDARSPLLREALKTLNIDSVHVPQDRMRLADARCQTCENADACFSWLAGLDGAQDYHWFCPNAQLFDDLTKAA
jgi:DNA polymerase III psi subunit